MDEEKFSSIDKSLKAHVIEEAKLAAHENDPLNTELRCWIQPLAIKRPKEYCAYHKCSVDVAVNMFVKSCLYDEGF